MLAEGGDVLIAASGYAVHEALKAMAALSEEGVEVGLIDLYSLPFDGEAIAQAAQASGGRVVTVEDNYGAGFGSEVAEAVLEHGGSCKVKQMYVKRIPKSGGQRRQGRDCGGQLRCWLRLGGGRGGVGARGRHEK